MKRLRERLKAWRSERQRIAALPVKRDWQLPDTAMREHLRHGGTPDDFDR